MESGAQPSCHHIMPEDDFQFTYNVKEWAIRPLQRPFSCFGVFSLSSISSKSGDKGSVFLEGVNTGSHCGRLHGFKLKVKG